MKEGLEREQRGEFPNKNKNRRRGEEPDIKGQTFHDLTWMKYLHSAKTQERRGKQIETGMVGTKVTAERLVSVWVVKMFESSVVTVVKHCEYMPVNCTHRDG